MRGVKDLLMEESRECIRNWRNVKEQVPYEKRHYDGWPVTWGPVTCHKRTLEHTQQPGEMTGDHRPSEDRHDDGAPTERKESLSATSDLNTDLSHIDL